VAFTLAACGTLPTPSGTIAGRQAAQAAVLLKSPQEATIRSGQKFELPAGSYPGAFDDEDGVYFEAPKGVVVHDHLFGMKMKLQPRTGGIYLSREDPTQPLIYSRVPLNRGSALERGLLTRPATYELRRGERLNFTVEEAR